MRPLTRAAVLGAGTMGSRIAAHLANVGIPTLLLDLAGPPEDRNRLARVGRDAALTQKPAAFFLPEFQDRVIPGNFDDDLPRLAACDWIIEAVAENLEIKRRLLERVEKARASGSVVSTNTSGIPVASIAEGFTEDLRRHWLGTHFFNPPRYMHLVEIIPGPDTLPEVVACVSDLCDRRLGKGVVAAKDTPNFIANRIGTFSSAVVFRLMQRDSYTVEEIDALTGPAIGHPKSATFRTLDLVGLDVAAHVLRNLHQNLPADPRRDWFCVPPFVEQMLERKWLGDKTGQGFYRKEKSDGEIWALDWKTLEYRPRQKVRFPSLDMARNIDQTRQRLPMLLAAGDRAAQFLWNLYSEVFVYAAPLVGEICDRVIDIDHAMRWGYAQELGPFEAWDVLGVEQVVARLRQDKREVPAVVERMLASGARSFYQQSDCSTSYFDLCGGRYQPLEPRPGILILKDVKRARRPLQSNAGASLVDLGDGVLCVEFHSKMNAIGEDQISMLMAGLKETTANFEAMIVANQGENFSVGANLVLVLMAAQGEEWDELDLGIRRFQQANLALKYAPKPVVAAPFGMALGGGCEISMHCARNQAAAELYMGLVEVGVGVIPGAGGTKELLLRLTDGAPDDAALEARVRQAFETIGYARVSTSAEEARRLGFLRPEDRVSIHRERVVAEAKAAALDLAASYRPGVPRSDIRVLGEAGLATLKMGIYLARQGGYISDYDAVVAGKLAHVLCGGRLSGRPIVSEQYLLDLEREAFLSLCGQRQTQERMQHMLKTGKPLRN
ncbi:MAG: 3-hydroxyacyl-CoA dehydrogenase/enoyl-CoA hydratase family protein [Acidobacteria bacterium]|nr:3-hydroxyacyl-CoA dehydrogenase/enoyl-CoA hydratase family protein [Acidobacteriota bacterium]